MATTAAPHETEPEAPSSMAAKPSGVLKFEAEPSTSAPAQELAMHHHHGPVPWWACLILACAVLAVSSAAAVFKMMDDVPAITLAAWRLQLTTVLLSIGAVWQWRDMSSDERRQTWQNAHLVAASGVCLALHFGCWVWGLEHTSLPHAVVLVSTTPIIVVAVAVVMKQPISKTEVGASVLALAGAGILAAGTAKGEAEATHIGDFLSFLAAAQFVAYITIGRRLRAWMPIFIYAAPVTGLAAATLTIAGLAFDQHTLVGDDHKGIFGWTTSAHYAPLILYLAVFPGIVGHTGFNTVLKYMSTLIIGLATVLEPVIAPFIGWALGVAAPPGPWTYVGGAVICAATAVVTYATAKREGEEKRQRQSMLAVTQRPSKDEEDGDALERGSLLQHNGRERAWSDDAELSSIELELQHMEKQQLLRIGQQSNGKHGSSTNATRIQYLTDKALDAVGPNDSVGDIAE